MKKILLFILCALFLFSSASGCKQKNKAYKISTPVDRLYWGMSEKEAVRALNLKDDITRKEDGLMVFIATEKKYNLYGSNVSLHMTFNEDLLSAIIAKINEEDLDAVEKKLTDKLGDGQYIYSTHADSSVKDVSSIAWNEARLKDDPELFDRIKKIYSEAGYDTSDMAFKNLNNRALVTYELILDKKSAKYRNLTIDGVLAALLKYPDNANKNSK